tara:strand:+ start:2519 stop:2839 length:321 start_codon:yes stop_codon:yes gene_type:complete
MGRQYEQDEWLEFLTGSDDQPDYAKKTQQKFEDRVEVLVDKHLPDEEEYPDIQEVAYLSFASLAGHGIGLWEGREEWHEDFEKVVEKDKRLTDLYYKLEGEVDHGE